LSFSKIAIVVTNIAGCDTVVESRSALGPFSICIQFESYQLTILKEADHYTPYQADHIPVLWMLSQKATWILHNP
jgi:hypothetical protein